jgi:hypothetical protein
MALPKQKSAYHSWDDGDRWDDDLEEYVEDGEETWRRSNDLKGKFIGIEWELEAKTGKGYTAIIKAMPDHHEDVDGPAPHMESDGSLDHVRGVEIIFPPVSPTSIRDPKSYFHRSVVAVDAAGITQLHNRCGMHMNVNCNGWSGMKKAIFMAVIHLMPQEKLEKLGGRELNGYCAREEHYSLASYEWEPSDDHGYAAEHKNSGTRIECRFPGATTNIQTIIRLTYFFEYLEDFAEAYAKKAKSDNKAEPYVKKFFDWLKEFEDAPAKELYAFLS